MNQETIQVTRHGSVLVITLNRPEARNAINRHMAEGIAAAADELDTDPELAVGILTGHKQVFSSGMDLKAFLRGETPIIEGRGLAGITATPPRKPLIAAVNGFAFAGGFELALACDLIVASASALFALPEVRRGLVAGGGGVVQLPRRIPRGIAMEMVLTGEPITASRAYDIGLVNRVSKGSALDCALEIANTIAKNAPLAIQASKEVIQRSQDWPLDQLYALQNERIAPVLASDDAREGASAFAEKRTPIWRGT